MQNLKNKRSIIQTISLSMFLVGFISISIIGSFWIVNEYNQFAIEYDDLKDSYLLDKQVQLRKEMANVRDYVDYMKSSTESRLKTSIKERTYEAHAIAVNIYNENKGRLIDSGIAKLIKDALRPSRFYSGRGYYFIGDFNYINQMLPILPELEGKSVANIKTKDGTYIIREMVKICKEKGEGYFKYFWAKPGRVGRDFAKISFQKHFKPFDWYIGTGEYLDDVEEDIKKEVLKRIEQIKFGKNGYVFVIDYDGNVLAKGSQHEFAGENVWDIVDPDGMKFVQKMKEGISQNPEGYFLSYKWLKPESQNEMQKKLSYVTAISEWKWLIGIGFNIDEVDQILAAKKLELKNNIIKNLLKIILILFTLFVGIAIVSRFISKKIKKSYNALMHFLEDATTNASIIKYDMLDYNELRGLAKTANHMIQEREKAKARLTESENKYRGLSDASFEGIIISDKGKILDVNSVLTNIVGYSTTELIGMRTIDLVAPENRDEVQSKILSDYEKPYEAKGLKKDGTIFPIEAHAKMFSYQGRQVRVTAVRDLTEKKKTEEEIKILSGLVPICSSCKKIRDDKGYWNLLESYIEKHSEASFSHGICPDCSDKLYGDEDWYIKIKKKKDIE